MALYFGTPLWPFATQLWGHATAAAWVVLGWYCLQRETRAGDAWGGWWLGLAVLTEYSTALLLPGWVLLWLVRRQPRRALALVAGGALPAVAFLAYHRLCFGQFLTIANRHINPLFTATAAAAWGITGSPYRGLFWFAPVTVVLLGAGLAYCRRAPAEQWLGLAGCGLFLVMNVSFTGWHGGASAGPRYLIPVLPLLALLGTLPAAVAPAATRRRWLTVLVLATAVSISHMLVCAAVGPLVPEYRPGRPLVWRNPLPECYRVFYLEGRTQLFGRDPLRVTPAGPAPVPANAAFNWGQRLGLEGPAGLVPWLGATLLLAGGLAWAERRRPPAPPR